MNPNLPDNMNNSTLSIAAFSYIPLILVLLYLSIAGSSSGALSFFPEQYVQYTFIPLAPRPYRFDPTVEASLSHLSSTPSASNQTGATERSF
jgi:hypothetical protein